MTTSCTTPTTEARVEHLRFDLEMARGREIGMTRGLLDFLERDGVTVLSAEGVQLWRTTVNATEAAERALDAVEARLR